MVDVLLNVWINVVRLFEKKIKMMRCIILITKSITIFICIVLLSSCTNQTNAKKAAGIYCNCMKKNGSPDQDLYAETICRAELMKKYRYYKIFYVDMMDDELSKSISQQTSDSTQKFMSLFMESRLDLCK